MTIDSRHPARPQARRGNTREAGFTLAELLVVVALIAVIMLVALPAFGNFNRAWKLRSAADEMAAAVRGARQRAITKRQDITVTFTDATDTYSYQYREDPDDPNTIQTVSVTLPDRIEMVTNPSGTYAPVFRINGSISNVSSPSVSAPTSNFVYLESVISGARTDRYTFAFSAAGQVKVTVTR